MAYNSDLADRIRKMMSDHRSVTERKMFGGLCFLLQGNMCCGVQGEILVVRLGNSGAAQALEEPHTRPMDFTGKPLKSMVYVDREGTQTDAELEAWVARGLEFARSLPSK